MEQNFSKSEMKKFMLLYINIGFALVYTDSIIRYYFLNQTCIKTNLPKSKTFRLIESRYGQSLDRFADTGRATVSSLFSSLKSSSLILRFKEFSMFPFADILNNLSFPEKYEKKRVYFYLGHT